MSHKLSLQGCVFISLKSDAHFSGPLAVKLNVIGSWQTAAFSVKIEATDWEDGTN